MAKVEKGVSNWKSDMKQKYILMWMIHPDSEVTLFSPGVFVCVCLCLSRCLSEPFNCEGLVAHKKYFTGTPLGKSSRTFLHDSIFDINLLGLLQKFGIL